MRRTIISLTLLMLALPAFAADSSVDNLTVLGKAVFHGDIELAPLSVAAPTNGLVLHHSYSSDSMSVEDLSGLGNGGIVNGATWTNSGIGGGALSYDGIDDYIEVSDAESLNVTTALTVSVWVMATAPPDGHGWDGLVTKGNFSDRLFGLQRWGSKVTSIYMYGGQGRWAVTSTKSVSDGQWHQVVTTWNGQKVSLYVDGEESVDYSDPNNYGWDWSTPLVSITQPVWIGRISSENNYPFQYFNDGAIDEVRIYNRALSPDEVARMYLSDLGVTNISSSAGVVQSNSQATNVFMGRVGIGTANPTEMLDVAGNLAVSGTIKGLGSQITGLPVAGVVGLGSAATMPSTDFATAAQGLKADSALQRTGDAMAGTLDMNGHAVNNGFFSGDGSGLVNIPASAITDLGGSFTNVPQMGDLQMGTYTSRP
ncbi:MAG: LamG domain-containing protein [Chloroflexota bacterium]